MGASLDSRDQWHANVGYVFQNLSAFIVNLAPNTGIGDFAEGWKINARNEIPACSRQDHDLVRSILRNPVKGIDKLRMILRRENERPTVAMEFDNQHTVGISRELQAAIGSEVVSVKCLHSIVLSRLTSHDLPPVVRPPLKFLHADTLSGAKVRVSGAG